ncbi:hypothetical protein Tco_0871492 [Tanacetum coccineum]
MKVVSFLAKNHVMEKFLRALHPKWHPKVTAIEESKDLTSLLLYELIGNLKVYEVIIKKDSEMVKGRREQSRSLTLKAKNESSDEDHFYLPPRNSRRNEEYDMANDRIAKVKENTFSRFEIQIHTHRDANKPSRKHNQRAFVEGACCDSDEEKEEKTKDENCLVAKASNKEESWYALTHDELSKDSGYLQRM